MKGWRPIPNDWVQEVQVSGSGGLIAGGASGPWLSSVYGSGGSCGVGGVKTYGDPANPLGKSVYWPCAYGSPTATGEQNIGLNVAINPTGPGTVLNNEVGLTMKQTGPSAQQKRVGVTQVNSVEWISRNASGTRNPGTPTAADLAKVEASGGGFRTFPEKTTPTSPVYDKVEVNISLAAPIPTGMTGRVYVAWFDPNNPIGSTKTPTTNGPGTRDNHGSIKYSDNNHCVTFSAGESSKGKGFQVETANAGDSYIVAAQPNAIVKDGYRFKTDGQTLRYQGSDDTWNDLPVAYRTSVLTVWRTLNVECDRTRSFMWSDTIGAFAFTSFPTLGGIPEDQFKRACILLEPYDPEAAPSTVDRLDLVQDPLIQDDKNKIAAQRVIPQPSPDFWTAHIIMAFWGAKEEIVIGEDGRNQNWHGWSPYTQVANTSLIFERAIKATAPNNVSLLTQRTIAHELGHLMGLDHPASGLMIGTDIGSEPELSDILNPDNLKFTIDDLKNMQSMSEPR